MPDTTETASDLTRVDGVRVALRRSFAARELRIDRLAFERDRALLIEGEVASLAAKNAPFVSPPSPATHVAWWTGFT